MMHYQPRPPTSSDYERVLEAIQLVGAYQMGGERGDFDLYGQLIDERRSDLDAIESLTQLSWALGHLAADQLGVSLHDVLSHYGVNFAQRAEELR